MQDETQQEALNRLHNRNFAKIMDFIDDDGCSNACKIAIKQQLGFYVKDIKEQVLQQGEDYGEEIYRQQQI